MTIDYSKWDNIDTDSEPEDLVPPPPQPIPVPGAQASATSSASTTAPALYAKEHIDAIYEAQARLNTQKDIEAQKAFEAEVAAAPGDHVKAVIASCDLDKETKLPWYPTTLEADHPIFSNTALPISELIELPLVMHKVGTTSSDPADLICMIATYMNIDPTSGFAPPEWQAGQVGSVIIARKDKKPLRTHHMEGVWMYCDYILDVFGEGNGAPTHMYNRKAFEEWWGEYCENQRLSGRGGGGENSVSEGWDTVKSPYEV